MVIKTVLYWHKKRHTDQWNRLENPEINPSICNQMIFNKGAKAAQLRNDSLFNKWCWENWTFTFKIRKLYPYPVSYTTSLQVSSGLLVTEYLCFPQSYAHSGLHVLLFTGNLLPSPSFKPRF